MAGFAVMKLTGCADLGKFVTRSCLCQPGPARRRHLACPSWFTLQPKILRFLPGSILGMGVLAEFQMRPAQNI